MKAYINSWPILLLLSTLLGVNLAFLAISRKAEQQQLLQIETAVRPAVINNDYGAVKEFLHRLKPTFISDFLLVLEGQPLPEGAASFSEMAFYFDRDNKIPAGRLLLKPNRNISYLYFALLNLVVGTLLIAFAIMTKHASRKQVEVERKAFSSFLSRLKDVLQDRTLSTQLEIILPLSQRDLSGAVAESLATVIRLQKIAAVGDIAAQVAHDIRSPLAALETIVRTSAEVNPEQRLMLMSAASRIREIADDLIEREHAEDKSVGVMETRSVLLAPVIELLILEKSIEFSNRPQVKINLNFAVGAREKFAIANVRVFKRILSNLINNAVEANPLSRVSTFVEVKDKTFFIHVEDDGVGMTPDQVSKLGSRGTSFNDRDGRKGSGLGLYHAKKNIKDWGGALQITSVLQKGTTASISLKQSSPPKGFLSKLTLSSLDTIVVVDDDKSIFRVWESRLVPLGIPAIYYFHDAPSLIAWLALQKPKTPTKFLIDQDFGQGPAGTEIIELLKISKSTVLTTSKYEDTTVINEAEAVGVKIIPKQIISSLQIDYFKASPSNSDVIGVLLDDDESVQKAWALSAKRLKANFYYFSDFTQLIANRHLFADETPIYIDMNLSDHVDGVEIGRRLQQEGFQKIIITTGTAPSRIPTTPWISKVIGKVPPWLEG